MSNVADAIAVGPGPIVNPITVIADGEYLRRVGDEIVGGTGGGGPATAIEESGGQVLTIGSIGFDRLLYRSGGTEITGRAPSDLYLSAWAYIDQINPVFDAPTFDWDVSYYRSIGVVRIASATDISLPAESSITNWAPGSPPRWLYKMNGSAFGINLLVTGNCTINGGAAGADMAPIPDTNTTPGVGVLAQCVRVYRASATEYFVFGGQ